MTVGKEYELGRINDIEFQMSWYHNLQINCAKNSNHPNPPNCILVAEEEEEDEEEQLLFLSVRRTMLLREIQRLLNHGNSSIYTSSDYGERLHFTT